MSGLNMITIDRKQYKLDSLSSYTEKQLSFIQFANSELSEIQAESIGWIPLDEGAYLHLGSDTSVIEIVGIAKPDMQGSSVLWVF